MRSKMAPCQASHSENDMAAQLPKLAIEKIFHTIELQLERSKAEEHHDSETQKILEARGYVR